MGAPRDSVEGVSGRRSLRRLEGGAESSMTGEREGQMGWMKAGMGLTESI